MSKQYHVAKNGSDYENGSLESPFLTINKAASVATAGDEVIVHEGTYREHVNPQNSGLSRKRNIVYKAADGEKVIIKGSEIIKDWELIEGNIWKVTIPNSFFKDYNPYKEKLFGDWLIEGMNKHLGNVYLNGMAFYEVENYSNLHNPDKRTEVQDQWTQKIVTVKNPEQTQYVWFAEVEDEETAIYANFQKSNPNEELVEINVRKSVFYPEQTGLNYITVKGFEMAHAATPWAPPTADQPGLIGPHWSKEWIIEDNIIHDAKTSAISLGKEDSTGNNHRTIRKDKSGYQYQIESILKARDIGWDKDNIGSHIVRNNTLFDCGQNGIVGNLGSSFSEIYNNHIYNIGIKREFVGHEIGGIKLHAPLDTQIYNNRIHDCSLGIWLDWELQGTRISKNLFYNNTRDLFVEVSHGPFIVDHNILTADYALDNHAQGGAYINNIIAGDMVQKTMKDRATPYHIPHSTKIAGFAATFGGDDRYYNNIFIGGEELENVGTSHFDGQTSSLEEYISKTNEDVGSDHYVFQNIPQPVYINDNVYFNGAKPFEKEDNNLKDDSFDPQLKIIDEGDEGFLSIQLPESFKEISGKVHSTNTLERVRLADANFENPDESELVLDTDYLNNSKDEKSGLGPIEQLTAGENYIKIW